MKQGLLKYSVRVSFCMFAQFFYVCFSLSGVFALLQAYAFLQYLKDRLTRQEFQTLFFLGVSLAAGVVFLTVIYLTYTGLYICSHDFTVLFSQDAHGAVHMIANHHIYCICSRGETIGRLVN